MLRNSVRSVRALGGRPAAPVGGLQWPPTSVAARRLRGSSRRTYADEAAKPETGTPPVQAPVPPAKSRGVFRRVRNLILTLTILGGVSFGGGVWYSRVNDNFHDFFTEYVPFGEQAVLYFEEMDFRKRFPHISGRAAAKPRDTGENIKVPARSGASWRVADSAGGSVNRQSSAVKKVEAAIQEAAKPADEKKLEAEKVAATLDAPKPSEATKAADKPAKAAEPAATVSPKHVETPVAVAAPAVVAGPVAGAVADAAPKVTAAAAFKPPEVNEPSRFPPIAPLDPIKIDDAAEPVVQDLVKMLNDIITVINADNAHARYGATIEKAKGELSQVGGKIKSLKKKVEKKAAKEVRNTIDEFDKAATGLVERVEKAMAAQEAQWRQEFEDEMTKVRASYDERVKLLAEREQKLGEERLNNRLLEQALLLKKEFVADVKHRVEAERDGRLGQLDALSSAVTDLEKLTTGWTDVVDTNLKTQQLHVAVEAVRASLETATHPKPFTRELVALKEIASDDAVVNAAIASINPTAYQRGVASPAQLVDRFRRVATEVRKASLLPDEAGVASHASSWLLSMVLFKKSGLAAGNDVESILTRTQTYLEEGDLDAAAREMNGLTGWAKTLSRDWLAEVRKVLEVQQALDVIATEARLQSLKVE